MIQPEPTVFDKCRNYVTRPSKVLYRVMSGATAYAQFCCIGFLSKLIPDKPKSDTNSQEDEAQNAPLCRCHEESYITKACHGDLYYLGLSWISVMKTALLGRVLPPVVAAPPPLPEKPPKMPYKELPLYDTPHKDYREGKESAKPVCPEAKQNLLQNYLLPTVTTYRKKISDVYYQNKCVARNFLIDQGKVAEKKYNDFVTYMRQPYNMPYRVGAVAASSLVGLRIGWRGGIPRKTFFTGLGALAGGALAFPCETDRAFRTMAFHTGNAFLSMYNIFAGTCESMPETKPCKEPVKERPVCETTDSLLPSKEVPCPLDPPKK